MEPRMQQGIVYRGQSFAILVVRKFRPRHQRAALIVDYPEVNDEMRSAEHADIDADGLQNDTVDNQGTSKQDRPLATDMNGKARN